MILNEKGEEMKTACSVSGGKSSAYMAAEYPADINIFSLVRIEAPECLWMNGKDEKTRQLVSDRIGQEFIATAEMDAIIYTILDLEQYMGREIKMITGETFDQIILNRGGGYLPNKMVRYCTIDMKLIPIFNYLKSLGVLPCVTYIGYRPEEKKRIKRIKARGGSTGIETFKTITGKRGTRNKWENIPYRKVVLPLVEDNIGSDIINSYWKGKPVRFAKKNNCVICVNRNPLLISHYATRYNEVANKLRWAIRKEQETGSLFINQTPMSSILKYSLQGELFVDEDFSECDSGDCGI